MNDMGRNEKRESERSMRYREPLRLLKSVLHPLEPDPEFSRHLEELCESMGAWELFGSESAVAEETGHRGIIIGVFSALPFVGVAAYAVRRHLLRRRIVPVGV